jgi:hypothetical protein
VKVPPQIQEQHAAAKSKRSPPAGLQTPRIGIIEFLNKNELENVKPVAQRPEFRDLTLPGTRHCAFAYDLMYSAYLCFLD